MYFKRLINFLLNYRAKKPPVELVFPAAEHWFQSEEGQLLLCAEQYLIKRSLSSSFGYFIMQMSVCRNKLLSRTARVQHKFCVYPIAGRSPLDHVDLVTDIEQLPLASCSVDAVVLHHSHEFVENPQQLLREIERVMVRGGHLVVVGFNPYSLMGIQGALARFFPRSVWHNKSYSQGHMEGWLSILGFQSTQKQYGYHRFAAKRKKSHNKLWVYVRRFIYHFTKKLPLGSFYCITAVKQEAAIITPDTLKWRQAASNLSALSPKTNIRQGKIVPFKKS
ncbi:MAG: SAM-dependent methyltransferase [Pseudohongiellaceae bacterium]|jgi:SAM-dependent methyltransferase